MNTLRQTPLPVFYEYPELDSLPVFHEYPESDSLPVFHEYPEADSLPVFHDYSELDSLPRPRILWILWVRLPSLYSIITWVLLPSPYSKNTLSQTPHHVFHDCLESDSHPRITWKPWVRLPTTHSMIILSQTPILVYHGGRGAGIEPGISLEFFILSHQSPRGAASL